MNRGFRFCLAAVAFAVILFHSESILACAVCFGDPNSFMNQGARAGILILLGVIGTVLAFIVGVALFWIRRARLLQAGLDPDAPLQGRLRVGLPEQNGTFAATDG